MVIRRTVLHIAIFGYMQNSNLTDPMHNCNPNYNSSTLFDSYFTLGLDCGGFWLCAIFVINCTVIHSFIRSFL